LFADIVQADLREGIPQEPRWTARSGSPPRIFHRPEELRAEIDEAGFEVKALLGLEGPRSGSCPTSRSGSPIRRPQRGSSTLVRAIEEEPSIVGQSAHLVGVGRRAADSALRPRFD
jgi:hypothetical protein